MNKLNTLKDIKKTIDFYVGEFGEDTNIEFILPVSLNNINSILVK